MLLAHHRQLVTSLREPTSTDPWRVLVSGCLAGWKCGVDASDNGVGARLAALMALPTFRAFAFCPEQHALGTPRSMPDIHGGDGFDVIARRARVLDQHGVDLTEQMLQGARAMLAFAQDSHVELAILTDMSAACGSQVISKGCRLVQNRRYQKGVGVATALLLDAGIPVISQRDFNTIALLRARLEPGYTRHRSFWTITNIRGRSRISQNRTRAGDRGREHRDAEASRDRRRERSGEDDANGNVETWRDVFVGRDAVLVHPLRTHFRHRRRMLARPEQAKIVRLRGARELEAWVSTLQLRRQDPTL